MSLAAQSRLASQSPKWVLPARGCGRRAISIRRKTGVCPGLAACGAGGAAQRTAAGIARLRGCRDPAADALPLMRSLHPLDSAVADGQQSVRASSRYGAAHRSGRSDRSGSCSGHGAAVSRPGTKPDLDLPWSSLLEMVLWWRAKASGNAPGTRPVAPNTSMPMCSARVRWL